MNPLTEKLITGTVGELLVQVRLFQYDVQAAPPLKDSGNDLIAVRGETLKAIQVKTTATDGKLPIPQDRLYHILAFVRLDGKGNNLLLDSSKIYLIEREAIDRNDIKQDKLDDYLISQDLVDRLFPPPQGGLHKQSQIRTQRAALR